MLKIEQVDIIPVKVFISDMNEAKGIINFEIEKTIKKVIKIILKVKLKFIDYNKLIRSKQAKSLFLILNIDRSVNNAIFLFDFLESCD